MPHQTQPELLNSQIWVKGRPDPFPPQAWNTVLREFIGSD
jgi:hypothetical protein